MLNAQESLMDEKTRTLLDSLDHRAAHLESELPSLLENKSPKWFYKKRELDYTLFLKHYHSYLFEEELGMADKLIDSRLEGAKKRGDKDAIDFYLGYQKLIAVKKSEHQRHYQQLFAKEKNFRKAFMVFVKQGDEYSMHRAIRMTDLAIKYAEEKKLKEVQEYLNTYRNMAQAGLQDLQTDYDLKKMTDSEKIFLDVFTSLVESDSLESITEAGRLVQECFTYSKLSKSTLDTSYFTHQAKIVRTSISDYYDREGNLEDLALMEGQSILVRTDSLNRDGIYKWHDMILVIGYFTPEAKFVNVQKGEAVIQADRRLIDYIRVNRLASIGKDVSLGAATIIPFQNTETASPFKYNPEIKKYQYMICYSLVENQKVTRQITKFLPPLLFDLESESL